eukprot:gene315-573_t
MSTPNWESSKENVLPIKRGRSAKGLNYVMSTDTIAESESRFEQEILNTTSSSDPLIVWLQYFKWIRDTYPSDSSRALKLLERCTVELRTDNRYINDVRFIKMWIEYADMVRTPGEIFSYMNSNKIGIQLSLFWIAWAFVAEKLGNYKLTDQIFQKGIKRKAEPVDILSKRYQQFQRRMARHYLNATADESASGAEQNSVDDPPGRQRVALSSLSSHNDENAVSSTRRGEGQRQQQRQGQGNTTSSSGSTHSSSSHRRGQVPPIPVPSTRPPTANTSSIGAQQSSRYNPNPNPIVFTVFDDSSTTDNMTGGRDLIPENPLWKTLAPDSSRRKENEGLVSKWSEGPLVSTQTLAGPGHGHRPQTQTQTPALSIFVDEQYQHQVHEDEHEPSTSKSKETDSRSGSRGGGGGLSLRLRLDGDTSHERKPELIAQNPLARHTVLPLPTKHTSDAETVSDALQIQKNSAPPPPEQLQPEPEQSKRGRGGGLDGSRHPTRTETGTSDKTTIASQAKLTAAAAPSSSSSLSSSLSSSFAIFEDHPPSLPIPIPPSTVSVRQDTPTNTFSIFSDEPASGSVSKNKPLSSSLPSSSMSLPSGRDASHRQHSHCHQSQSQRESVNAVVASPFLSISNNNRDRDRDGGNSPHTRSQSEGLDNGVDDNMVDDFLNELGMGKGYDDYDGEEEGTINTRLARREIDSLFCDSPMGRNDNDNVEDEDEAPLAMASHYSQGLQVRKDVGGGLFHLAASGGGGALGNCELSAIRETAEDEEYSIFVLNAQSSSVMTPSPTVDRDSVGLPRHRGHGQGLSSSRPSDRGHGPNNKVAVLDEDDDDDDSLFLLDVPLSVDRRFKLTGTGGMTKNTSASNSVSVSELESELEPYQTRNQLVMNRNNNRNSRDNNNRVRKRRMGHIDTLHKLESSSSSSGLGNINNNININNIVVIPQQCPSPTVVVVVNDGGNCDSSDITEVILVETFPLPPSSQHSRSSSNKSSEDFFFSDSDLGLLDQSSTSSDRRRKRNDSNTNGNESNDNILCDLGHQSDNNDNDYDNKITNDKKKSQLDNHRYKDDHLTALKTENHDIPPDVTDNHEIPPDVTDNHEIPPDMSLTIMKYHQMSLTIMKYHQMSLTIMIYHQMSLTIMKYHQMSLATSWFLYMLLSVYLKRTGVTSCGEYLWMSVITVTTTTTKILPQRLREGQGLGLGNSIL